MDRSRTKDEDQLQALAHLVAWHRENFRLSVEVATALEDLISGTVAHDTGLNMALTPRQQLLVSLRFYATGAYLRLVGDGHGVSEATVCRAIHRVTDAIIHRCPGAITWPSDPAALGRLKEDFRRVAGLPDIVGIDFDGTHVNSKVIDPNCCLMLDEMAIRKAKVFSQTKDRSASTLMCCVILKTDKLVGKRMTGRLSGLLKDLEVKAM
ncbi:putative nuclease HARBI1 [Amphibalanus amphitrite]|uniref:Putative nuclease HARBI1 n=1 Tax=Amphibalanus amphitrite TaxID=1232801 RepID=A0A6A4VS72_AMPAM|nr:putative nuclease HARBI1 [Amphibalanus amphitrite]